MKVAPGDQIKSLNGTYSGDVVSVQTAVGGNPLIVMDTAATVAFANTDFIVMSGIGSGLYLREGNTVTDWYNEQTLGLTNTTIRWRQIAEAPTTTEYAKARNSKYDEFHVLIVDDTGSVTGTAGAIVEKWVGLSKALDAKISPSTDIYYKNYVANFSQYAFVGAAQTGMGLKYSMLSGYTLDSSGTWGSEAQGKTFNGVVVRHSHFQTETTTVQSVHTNASWEISFLLTQF